MLLSHAEFLRYQRHMDLCNVGYAGQKKIKAARVLIVGMGGLGTPLALYLTTSGIGTIGLVDHDCVDLSNLHRQILYTEHDIGQSKVHCAQRMLQARNSHCVITSYPQQLCAENAAKLIHDYDIIADCTDNFTTRYLTNQVAAQLNKTYSTAAVNHYFAQIALFPANSLGCYHCLFGHVDSSKIKNCATAGVFGTTTGIVGTLQAQHIVNHILNPTTPGYFIQIDTLNIKLKKLALSVQTVCDVCSKKGR